MKKALQAFRVMLQLLSLMRCRYWHRLLVYFVGVAIYRTAGLKLFDGIRLPFRMVTAFGAISGRSGLTFLAEIAARHAYADFMTGPGNEGRLLYDVGANCGFFTLVRCRNNPSLHAYCFEPHPATFGILEMNIRINGLQERVIPINAAVGRSSGTLLLSTPASSSMAIVLAQPSGDKNTHEHVLPVVSLDDFVQGKQNPDSLKIDVEGHEEQVLIGARNVLAAVKRVVIEVHSKQLEDNCRGLLAERGFRIMGQGALLFCDRPGDQDAALSF